MKATLINYVIFSPFISSFPKPLDRLEIDFLNNYVMLEKYSENNFLLLRKIFRKILSFLNE